MRICTSSSVARAAASASPSAIAARDHALERGDGARPEPGADRSAAPLLHVVRGKRRVRIRGRIGSAGRSPVVAVARCAGLGDRVVVHGGRRRDRRGVGAVVVAEAVAVPGVGAHRIAQAHVGERGARQADDPLQCVVDDDRAGPEGLEQLVLAHHAVAVADQVTQQIEDARLQLDLASVCGQRASRFIQHAGPEPVSGRVGRRHTASRKADRQSTHFAGPRHFHGRPVSSGSARTACHRPTSAPTASSIRAMRAAPGTSKGATTLRPPQATTRCTAASTSATAMAM